MLTAIGTWTSAESLTTDNLFDDPYNDFLDGKYEYPNIHMHGDGSYDPYIYTGSSLNYGDSAVAKHEINLDKLTYEITKVNYGYKYFSYAPGEVAIAIALIDDDGTMIDDSVMEYNITTNEWVNIDRVYNDAEKLSRAKELWMGVAGSSDWNGTDDIRIGDIYMTYDYQEIPLDIIVNPVYDIAKVEIKYDLDANGLPKIDDIKVEEVKVETKTEETPQVAEVNEAPKQEAKQETTATKSESKTTSETKQVASNEKSDKKEKSQKEVKKDGKASIEMLSQAGMSQDVMGGVPDSFFTGNTDFFDVGGVELSETIALNEGSFYEDTDFYEEQHYSETLQLSDKINLKEQSFYGSNYQFY